MYDIIKIDDWTNCTLEVVKINTEKIKLLREKSNLTQKETAKKLGISIDYISMLERGKRTPSLKLAKRIADLFGCTIDDIFFNNTHYKMSDDDKETTTIA